MPDVVSPAERRHVAAARSRVTRLLTECQRVVVQRAVRRGVLWLLGVAMLLAAASYLFDRTYDVPPAWRFRYVAFGLVLLGLIGLHRLLLPVRRCRMSPLDLVHHVVERQRPGTTEAVANVLEFSLPCDRATSAQLAHDSVVLWSDRLIGAGPPREPDQTERRRYLAVLAASGFVLACSICLFPGHVAHWYQRWFLFSPVGWPRAHYLAIPALRDGTVYVPRREPVELVVVGQSTLKKQGVIGTLHERPKPLHVRWAVGGVTHRAPRFVRARFRDRGGNDVDQRLEERDDGRFLAHLPPHDEPLSVELVSDEDSIDNLVTTPCERPIVTGCDVAARWGSGRDDAMQSTNTRQLLVPAPAQLDVTVRWSEPVDNVTIEPNLPDGAAIEHDHERTTRISCSVDDRLRIEVAATSMATGLAARAYGFECRVQRDRVPHVYLSTTYKNARISPGAIIPVRVMWNDDRGIAKGEVVARRTTSGGDREEGAEVLSQTPLQILHAQGRSGEQALDITVSDASIEFGQRLLLQATVEDAALPGAQQSRSKLVVWEVVARDELVEETRQMQRTCHMLLEQIVQRWSSDYPTCRDDLPALRELARIVGRRSESIVHDLHAVEQTMRVNRLVGAEQLDRMQHEVTAPLRQIVRDDLMPIESAESIDSNQLGARAEHVESALRTVLRKMRVWEGYADVLRQFDSLIQWQIENLDATRDSQQHRVEELFDE